MTKCFAPQLCSEDRRQEIRNLLLQLVEDKENVEVLVRLGRLHFTDQDHPQAFRHLWQAYDLGKARSETEFSDIEATMALADLHMMRGEYSYAKRKYWEAIQIDWSRTDAHDGLKAARIGNPKDSAVHKDNKLCKGVLRTIFPEQAKAQLTICEAADRATGEVTIQFGPK